MLRSRLMSATKKPEPLPPLEGGLLYVTGANNLYQLGLNDTTNRQVFTQLGADDWALISGGSEHVLAIKPDGTLWAWGNNADGRTGLNTTTGSAQIPTQVGTDTDWRICSAGLRHSAAIKSDGTLWTFGFNNTGQLGLGDTTSRSVPTQVGSDTNWLKVAATSTGGNFTIALKTDNSLWSMGSNGSWQTGLDPTVTQYTSPTQVGSDTNWTDIAAGSSWSLALKSDGTMWSTGLNTNARTGRGTASGTTNGFTQIGSDTNWSKITAGTSHGIAIKTNGTMYSWGNNVNGRTGLNTDTGNTLNPTQIGSDTNWSLCSADSLHSLAIKTTGTLWSWGNNTNGETGLNTITGSTLVPTQVDGSTDWAICSAGSFFSLVHKQ